MDGLDERLAQALASGFLVGNTSGRGVAAFGCGVRVRAGDEHVLRLPTGDLGGGSLGFVAHLATHADSVHHGNHRAALAVFKCHRPHMQGIVHVSRFARAQLERFHRRRNIHHRRAHLQAIGPEGEGDEEEEKQWG